MSGTIRALCHRAHQSSTTRDVALDRHLPDCEDILKEVIWAFSDFVREIVVCMIRKPVTPLVIPGIP
ncbi:hypothetical protein K3Q15_004195 [Escherichia coli]|nr:hypothetical protein [Escherichia coli]EFK1742160.1 hypothetical protein [Escherichia coli]EFL5821350.1 hypothetical protein [Escherichia coli]EGM7793894.1 hypothetical protein [Escherichia coli]EHX1939623.1 hypothetical protein [Escherichia coli]